MISRHVEIEGSGAGIGMSPGALELERALARNLVEARLSRGKQYLDGIAAQLKTSGLTVKTTLAEGSADENIVDYAKNNDIDLITMSRHGYSGLKRFFMGSVTDRVIRNGDTPVLVLPG